MKGGWRLTCDRAGGLSRAALWQDGEVTDLYIDREAAPDMTGAIVRARALRVSAGGKKAWFDAGLAQTLYLEGGQELAAGDVRVLRITTTRGQGKGWSAKETVFEGKETAALGLLVAPPPVWARALADAPSSGKGTICLAAREDEKLCRAFAAQSGMRAVAQIELDAAPHPDLDELIAALRSPRVALAGGGELVIEPTEALVAIDVNGGEAANPTAINLRAVREAARQIRLRNLSGMIVIDLLRMAARADGAKVMNAFDRASASDPAQLRSYGLGKMGLLELTRARRGGTLEEMMEGIL